MVVASKVSIRPHLNDIGAMLETKKTININQIKIGDEKEMRLTFLILNSFYLVTGYFMSYRVF